ncbi:hypothetical protein [Streptomyces sp. NPDC050856]|uniref:hypothetical protein n=1 Tax=Streptomyces sp. NPDC050856 TaxID=3154939 RepID=UPI0034112C87
MHSQEQAPSVTGAHDGHQGHEGYEGYGAQGGHGTHDTTTTERGSFCVARCGCGWAGPARRSRDRARTDADAHRSAPDAAR